MSNPTKAALYLNKLQDARCEGKWDQVPELVRKIRKHASDRICITTTAETEQAIAASPSNLDTALLSSKLLEAIGVAKEPPEEIYNAQVCLGWLHWTAGEYDIALAHLPVDPPQTDAASEWTRVCILKAAYIKAQCLYRADKTGDALAVFAAATTSSSPIWSGHKGRKQLQFWAELLLTEYCMLQSQALATGVKSLEDHDSLVPFRSWAKYWDAAKSQGQPLVGGHGFRGAVPRRVVWKEYYNALSSILQQNISLPAANVNSGANGTSDRSHLRMEVKRVEIAYEGLLLSETSFPRADEEREEVEAFVAAIMKNWAVLVGRDWYEEDIGTGGKEGLSRGVLDILYRAATKTFHSTAILRHLFTVHLAVAEFDLAFHALDSYVEIVKKAKARVDKTGHPEPSLDDDSTVLETISQAIIALCKYGSAEAAEKASDLGIGLEEMLEKLPAPLPNSGDLIPTVDEENANGVILHPRLSAQVYSFAWQAIGLSNAQWSRITCDAPSRTELQTKAIRCLQKSLTPEIGVPTDVRTLFTLGLLLAEQREVAAAIDIVKAALASPKANSEQGFKSGPYWRERSLIPLWHLLALLLSARQEFHLAARACEAAFEQFGDPEVLFGTQGLQGAAFRSEHLNDVEAGPEKGQTQGLVDEMDDLEKEGIIEVKMTQLALLELLEGPEVAVNASQELLVLFTRLFGHAQTKAPQASSKLTAEAPKSSAGTFRSIRGSIFGDKSDKGQPTRRNTLKSEKSVAIPERPRTTQSTAANSTAAPSIQITKDNSDLGESQRSSRPSSSNRKNSLKKRDGSGQQRRAPSRDGSTRDVSILDGEAFYTPNEDGPTEGPLSSRGRGSGDNSNNIQSLPVGRGRLQLDSKRSAASSQGLVLDSLSCPNSLPLITFPDDQVKRQRQTQLIKVWLMIASFYRRSKLYLDAKGAIGEAETLAQGLELEASKDTSRSVTSRDPGWGGRTSLEEILGDVYAEMGLLAVDEGVPYVARSYFEEALMHYPDHLSATVGLSNILLDIYTEVLLPPPAVASIAWESANVETVNDDGKRTRSIPKTHPAPTLPTTPLGLSSSDTQDQHASEIGSKSLVDLKNSESSGTDDLPAPYKSNSLPLIDRLAARDRAYGMLSSLTKLGTGWNYSDAWFALARAHEESGQLDKAKDALWWCVELEEAMSIRNLTSVGTNGYVL